MDKKKNGTIIRNELGPLVNVNELPYPDYSIFEPERFYRPMQGKVLRILPMELHRGCPYTCAFCEDPSQNLLYRSKGIAKTNGGDVEIIYTRKYPPTINSKKETEFANQVAKELVGEKNVHSEIEPSMGGEDFSYMLNEKPGSYIYIGQQDTNHKANLHTTLYDFNDNLLPIGVNFWVKLVHKFFN